MANKAPVVICPFYKSHDKLCLTCEGVGDGEELVRRFRTRAERIGYMRRRCDTFGYQNCPIFKIIEEKYERKPEPKGRL
jgi:hypothetical protein